MIRKKFKHISTAIMSSLVLSLVATSIVPAFDGTVTVSAATAVQLNKSSVSLNVGKKYQLKVTGSTKTVKWSSSDTSVAAVSSKGKVTAKKAGSTVITAKVNSKEYTCKVTVKATEAATVYGKVTAISGSKVTLALGTMKEQGQNPPSTSSGTTPAAQPSGTPAAQSETTGDTSTGSGSNQNNAAPSGQTGSAPEMLTLTGETATITISDTSILSKESMPGANGQSTDSTATASNSSASLSDISEGTILKVTYQSSYSNLVSVVIIGAGQPGGTQGGGQPGGGSSEVNTGTSAYTLKDGETLSGGTYTSTNADENAIRAENSITASMNDVTVTKTAGAASSNDASSFYGLNSAILALGKATLNITGGTVTASAEGANGVFAYDGATINIADTTIDVSGGNAGGIEVAGGGILNATNLTVNSKVKAAIRSDRGGGTMTVNGGTYTTSGSAGAPAIYSTADITVSDAVLSADTSEAVVVEGMNSVALNNCTVTGNMSGTYGSGTSNIHNVMLYQSMSGDAEVGNSSFTMTGGSLTSNNGDMFYVTNTDCVIKLSAADLNLADGTKLLVVAGNDGSRGWGSVGSNGGDCTLTIAKQTLEGDITVDKISKLAMNITDSSTFTGSINSDGTSAATCSVTVDSSSTWKLTADSYITEFKGSMNDVDTNGHTLYVNGVAMN